MALVRRVEQGEGAVWMPLFCHKTSSFHVEYAWHQVELFFFLSLGSPDNLQMQLLFILFYFVLF